MDRKIPTTFEAIPQQEFEQVTPLISKGRVSIFYKGKNRNRGFITEDFANKLISTLPYVPVVGIYDENKNDFTSHSRDRDIARIYGLIPENPNGEWVNILDKDGIARDYYVADVYLYTGRLSNANKILGNPQSLELDINSIKGDWVPMDDGEEYFVYTDAYFIGLSALGKDIEPCFEGAAFFELLTQFGEYLSNSELKKDKSSNNFLSGGKEMDLNNFKLYSDETKNAIWKIANPNFSEENNWKIDKVISDYNENQVVFYSLEDSKYEKYDVSKKEDGTFELAENPISLFNVLVESSELENYNKLKTEYANYKDVLDAIATFKQTISEKDNKIIELEEAKTTYELEAKADRDAIQQELDALKADYEILKQEHDEKIKSEKESKISEYEDLISDNALNEIRTKIADYDLESLEKELLFVVRKEKPTMFEKQSTSNSFSPSAIVNHSTESGIVSILEKYRR